MAIQIPIEVNRKAVFDFTAISDFVSDPIEFLGVKDWTFSVTPYRDLVDGVPTYTIEASQDKKKWYEYDEKFTDVSMEDAIEERDYPFNFKYFRVRWNATNVTQGKITFILSTTDG